MRRILVTGAAGFIGYHLCERLLKEGNEVIGVDNLNDYYDPQLKAKRLSMLIPKRGFKFVKCDISDFKAMDEVFKKNKPTHVYNLAAEAGVLYSLENPKAFGVTNLMGFLCILEMCVQHKVAHLLYASSASVYGNAGGGVSKEDDNTDHPISLYGATKKANELMAHCYGESHGLKTTGFRFFTVYGEWGRPDMAIYLFADAIKNGKPVKIYDHGKVQRDFVYVGDIVGGLVKSLVNPRSRYQLSST